jgi:hypothetical protein
MSGALYAIHFQMSGAMRTQAANAHAVDSLARSVIANRGLSENAHAIDSLARTYGSFRTVSESIAIDVNSPVRALALGRGISESIPQSTTVAISFAGTRGVAETIPTSDSVPARFSNGGRGVSDTAGAVDTANGRLERRLSAFHEIPFCCRNGHIPHFAETTLPGRGRLARASALLLMNYVF